MTSKNKSKTRSRGVYLSELGLAKIEEAIKSKLNSDSSPGKITEYINRLYGETITEATIKKILQRSGGSDRRSIQRFLKCFEVSFLEEYLSKTPPTEVLINESPNRISRYELASRAAHHNLPPQHNAFIGRKDELEKLMEYLSNDYPQTIIEVDGIGGVGKTALVLEAAYLCLEKRENCLPSNFLLNNNVSVPYFGCIIWVSAKENQLLSDGITRILEAPRTLQEIYRKIAYIFQCPAILNNSDGTHIDKIISKLKEQSPKRNLLIIDNLETITDKRTVVNFIAALHNTKILITTRENVCNYANICLESLSDNESIELINQQLKLAKISLNDEQITRLCDACSGIPLAIIYTIGRLSVNKNISPSKFDGVIDQLKDADGDLAHFCFKQSVEEIKTNGAYKLLMAAAIFDESCCHKALIEVAGLTSEPSTIVSTELEKLEKISLLRFCKNGLYKMLPITREYAIAQLNGNPDFKKEAQSRWVEYYISYAKELYNSQSKTERFKNFHAAVDKDWKNFLTVLRFCKDTNDYQSVKELWSYLNSYANIRGQWDDRLYWLDWLIETSCNKREYKDSVSFRIRRGRTLLLMAKPEDLKSAKKILLQAWELRKYANFKDLDYLTNHLAGLYLRLEEYDKAHEWLKKEQENLDKQTELSEDERLNYQLYIDREKAETLFAEGKYQDCKELCNRIIEQAPKIKHYRNENYAKKIVSDIGIKEGNLEFAENFLPSGYTEVCVCEDKRRMAYYEVSLALLEKEKGNLPEAKEWISKALNNFKHLGMIRDYQKAREVQEIINS